MKIKTEARRQAFIAAAAKVFREVGFDATTMSEISAQVGGSKATLYGYFNSKEELFLAVIEDTALRHRVHLAFDAFNGVSLREGLLRLGDCYLGFLLSPEVINIHRMIIAQAGRSDTAKLFFRNSFKVGWSLHAEALRDAMERGLIRRADPWRAIMQFRSLCEADVYYRRLSGVVDVVTQEEIDEEVAFAVDTFWRAYGLT